MKNKFFIAAVSMSLLVSACGSDSNNKKGGSRNPSLPTDPVSGKPYDPTSNPYNPNPNSGIPSGNIGNAATQLIGSWISVTAPGSMANSETARLQFSNDGRFSITRSSQYNSNTNSVLQGTFSANAAGSFLSIDLFIGGNRDTNSKAEYPVPNPGQYTPGYGDNSSVPPQLVPCIGRLQNGTSSSYVNGNAPGTQQQLFLRCAWQGGYRPQSLDGSSEVFARLN